MRGEGDRMHTAGPVVANIRMHPELRRRGERPSTPVPVTPALGQLVGTSAPMQEVYEQIVRGAPSAAPVLILGESGTGKGVVGRRLHDLSPRRLGPFVAVNSSVLSPGLTETELFGGGDLPGDDLQRHTRGLFERARHDTLFLDAVTEMPMPLQARMLRFLESETER